MTIQLGRLSIEYVVAYEHGPGSRRAIDVIRSQWEAHQARAQQRSTISMVVNRWLITPAVVGTLLGLMIS